jgi:ABC-2 type transport system permease protein
MDIDLAKLSTDWAKAEVFSGKMIWFFSIIYIIAAIGFLRLGRTDMAKAFFWPLLIAGVFLIAVGAGLYLANQPRAQRFEQAYRQNPTAFVKQEIERTGNSQSQLKLVFRILPVIVVLAALLILFLPGSPNWRAIGITLVITAAFLMVVDSNTDARNSVYHAKLISLKQ